MFNLFKKKSIIEEDMLYKMANLHPIDTGLSSTLYSTFNGKEIFKTDIPIIKIEISIGLLPIKLNDIVEIDKKYKLNKDDKDKVDEAIQYINKYKKTFLEHWEGLITDKGLIDELFNGKKAKRIKK